MRIIKKAAMTNALDVWTSRVRSHSAVAALAVSVGLAFCLTLPLRAQTYTVLYRFNGGTDGANPLAGLVQDSKGYLYGTTYDGGDTRCDDGEGCGTVFKIDAGGNKTLVYSFGGSDGAFPSAALILDKDNDLYGTTFGGIGMNYGTVFKIDPFGRETMLHGFGGGPFGFSLSGGVIRDDDGTLYGTTQEGGASDSCWGGCGTVFKLDKAGNETVLLSFYPPTESPTATLIEDAMGHLYGITSGNGYTALGTVFRLNKDLIEPASSLYIFPGGPSGEAPYGGVVRDTEGVLYGTTFVGGDPNCTYYPGSGCGVVYELDPAGNEAVLYAFRGPDGALPRAGLLRDKNGDLYGTTSFGGAFGYGTVFKLDRRGKMTILHSFENNDGATPFSTLIQDAAGNLYGTTYYGGNLNCNSSGFGCGVVFKLAL